MSPDQMLAVAVMALGGLAASSVVILPGGEARAFQERSTISQDSSAFFKASASAEFALNNTQLLMSSFDAYDTRLTAASNVYPSTDSFVRGAIQAWGEHQHLVVRPDEVWFTILVQMNFYMNAHANDSDVRSKFVNHEGQEVIYIEDWTWYQVLERFQYEIQARVKTDWLLDWIRPNFTTTTESDRMTANILMMGLMQAYFRFEGGIICGLPSVTLLGTKADWQAILDKVERIPSFGAEPTKYASRLRPILKRFVASFDAPDSSETRSFWNTIVVTQQTNICGDPPIWLSGWITGFWFWDQDGRGVGQSDSGSLLKLDNVSYPRVDIRLIPVGYARVPFIMRDFNGTARFEAFVMAGTLGKKITKGVPDGYAAAVARAGLKADKLDVSQHSTLQPLSAWALYGPYPHSSNATSKTSYAEYTEVTGWLKCKAM